jgi:hypothetical protein
MSPLQAIEATAINTLLLLRREAAMTSRQIAQLQQLNDDFSTMQREMTELDHEFSTFKSHMFPEQGFSYSFSLLPEETIPYPRTCQQMEGSEEGHETDTHTAQHF